jgi:lipopolysaccharide heptosyltransferase III
MRRLLIRPGALGDCILCLPAMECLRAAYTEVWVPSVIAPLIRFADRVRPIASTGLDRLGLPNADQPATLMDELRSFDSIVSWYGANREEFIVATARLGLPFKFLPALPGPEVHQHAADFFLHQAGFTGRAVPRIECPPVEPAGIAIIHPFSGGPRKNWPLDRFGELAARLPLPTIWCAGPEEQLANAIRFDDLYKMACWLKSAHLYIGNDSGVTHLAAAVGAPVVALFGLTDPAIWAPRGERVSILHQDLRELTVDAVEHACLTCLRPAIL